MTNRIHLVVSVGFCVLTAIAGGCQGRGSAVPSERTATADATFQHPATQDVDAFDAALAVVGLPDDERFALYQGRWPAVRRAVDHAGVLHDDAFYGGRAYWHTGYLRGRVFSFEHEGDLIEPTSIDGQGAVRIMGDVKADLEMSGQAMLFIYGNVDAAIKLSGDCEVIIAGSIGESGAVACDGTLQLYVGGPMRGLVGSTGGSVVVVDGDLSGLVRCGGPSARVTVIGDAVGRVTATAQTESVLNLRVDGYMPNRSLLDVAAAGFTRMNATIGVSDLAPGLYPDVADSTRPATSRWVVLRQRGAGQ